jgi:MFS family permease
MDVKNGMGGIIRSLRFQIVIIGLVYATAQVFGFLEAEFFNTYLDHVLFFGQSINVDLYVGIMVWMSALMGLISNLILGIFSDNTRTRFGRRRPYLLLGGLVAGFSMILFAFTNSYWQVILLDVIIIGIASNSFYVAQKALIPDNVVIENRGKANAIANILGNIGLIIALALFILLYDLFGVPDGEGGVRITADGYFVAFLIGGGFFIAISIVGFLFIRETKGADLPPKKPFRAEIRALFNMEAFRQNKEFYKIVIAYIVFSAGYFLTLTYLFLYIFDLGLSTLNILLIIGISAPILFIVMYIIGRIADSAGRKKAIAPTIIISSIGFFLIPFLDLSPVPNLPLYIIAFTLLLINVLGIQTVIDAFYQDLLPEEERGKYLGVFNITQTASQLIGVGVGIVVTTFWGRVGVFAIAPIFFLASIPLFLRVKETLPKKAVQ